MLAGCTEPLEQIDNSMVELSSETISADENGGSFDVTITSSEDWRISGKPCDWFDISADCGKSGDKLVVTVQPNQGKEALTSELKIFSGSAVKTLTISSAGSYGITLISEVPGEFSSNGGILKLKLDTNIPDLEYTFTEDGENWIEFVKKQEVFDYTVITFNVKESDIYKSRSSRLTLSGEGKNLDIDVSQAQVDAVITDSKRIQTDLQEQDVTITLRANIDYEISGIPDWMEFVSSESGAEEEDGLVSTTYTYHILATDATRFANMYIGTSYKTYLQMSLWQQNPNPVLATISDKGLRMELNSKGLVIASEVEEVCEILAPGLSVTSLNVNSKEVSEISGLGSFPELTEIITGNQVNPMIIDLSDCKNIQSFKFTNNYNLKLQEIKFGDNQITSLVFPNTYYLCFVSPSLTISGNHLEEITMNSTSGCLLWSEKCQMIDVTGCPKLANLQVKREIYGKYTIKQLYISEAQKSAYDSGALSIVKSEQTEIIVK